MFNEAVITTDGLELDAKIRAGQTVAKFTHVKLGDGFYDGTEDLNVSADLKSIRQVFGVSSITILDNKTVRLRIVSNNAGIKAGYYISELGVYAEDPDKGEILYSLATGVKNKMDYQPSEEELAGATSTFDTFTSISNVETATIEIGTGAAASAEELEEIKYPKLPEQEGINPDDILDGSQTIEELLARYEYVKQHYASKDNLKTHVSDNVKHITGVERETWNGKVSASGGDLSNAKIVSADNITEEFPVPEEEDAGKTFLGKMKKFCTDFNNFKSGIITLVKLVNNGVCTEPGFALDARYGKTLQDQIDQQNRDFDSCFSFLGNYATGVLSNIITSLISNDKPCGYVFVGSGVSGLPSGYFGFVEYQSSSLMTSAIPIVLRMYNKHPVYGQIMLDTKAVEWNLDFIGTMNVMLMTSSVQAGSNFFTNSFYLPNNSQVKINIVNVFGADGNFNGHFTPNRSGSYVSFYTTNSNLAGKTCTFNITLS